MPEKNEIITESTDENVETVEATDNKETPDNSGVTDYQAEIDKLKSQVEHWKKFSRQHEDNYLGLKKENLIKDILSENHLPDEARVFLTASKEEELRAQADTFKSIIAATTPVQKVETAAAPAAVEQIVEAPAQKTIVVNPLQGVSSDNTIADPLSSIYAEVGKLFNS